MVGWHHQLNGHEFEHTRRQWRTGKPGVLQSMGSQRVRHDWVTEQLDLLIEHISIFWLSPRNIFAVHSLSHVQLFATPWTAARQASLSFTISQSLLRLMSIELVILSNHLVLCCPLLLLSIFPSIRVFSNESVLHIQYVKTKKEKIQKN